MHIIHPQNLYGLLNPPAQGRGDDMIQDHVPILLAANVPVGDVHAVIGQLLQAPPVSPVSPTVTPPIWRATSIARSTLGELPLAEMAIRISFGSM